MIAGGEAHDAYAGSAAAEYGHVGGGEADHDALRRHDHDVVVLADGRHADQQAETDMQPDRVGRKRRADQAERIEQRPAQHDTPRAMLVGKRADEGLDEPEKQILQRHREAKVRAADADIGAHLRQEQAERLAHAHRERDDERRAGDDDPRAFHGGECGGGHRPRMLPRPSEVKRA